MSPRSARRNDVGNRTSLSITHRNNSVLCKNLVPRAGLEAYSNRPLFSKPNLLISQEQFSAHSGVSSIVRIASLRKANDTTPNTPRRMSCRITKNIINLKIHLKNTTRGSFMQFTTLTIRGFKSVVKRKDIKSPQWFAMPIDILSHPDFFDISGDEFKAFTWIMGIASKLNCETIRVYPDVCSRQINVDRKVIELTIQKLNMKRWDVTDALRECHATVQNSTVQDSTEERAKAELLSNKYFKQIAPEVQDQLFSTYEIDFLKEALISGTQWIQGNPMRFLRGEAADYLVSHFARQKAHLKKHSTAKVNEPIDIEKILERRSREGL